MNENLLRALFICVAAAACACDQVPADPVDAGPPAPCETDGIACKNGGHVDPTTCLCVPGCPTGIACKNGGRWDDQNCVCLPACPSGIACRSPAYYDTQICECVTPPGADAGAR